MPEPITDPQTVQRAESPPILRFDSVLSRHILAEVGQCGVIFIGVIQEDGANGREGATRAPTADNHRPGIYLSADRAADLALSLEEVQGAFPGDVSEALRQAHDIATDGCGRNYLDIEDDQLKHEEETYETPNPDPR